MRKKTQDVGFAICIAAKREDDLQLWKVYQILHDEEAEEIGCLRVIDESGEDYLYPARRFVIVDLPAEARKQLLKAARRKSA
jgi:hypothetical protein